MRWMTAIALSMLCIGCACKEYHHKPYPVPEAMKEAMHPASDRWPGLKDAAALSSEAYEKKVREAGGRVDFIFGKDRPFAQCHASTIAQTADDTLLAAWFGGTEEGKPDVAVWMSRFVNGAWTAPVKAAKICDEAHWNPVFLTDNQKITYLFFKVGVDTEYWRTWWMQTADNGLTWTPPAELVAGDKGGRGPVKNKPIILSDGAWLAPGSTEFDDNWECFADRSEDNGKHWVRSADFTRDKQVLTGAGCIQPAFWESTPGKVHALVRTGAGRVWRADSKDYGRTWAAMTKTVLPNNNSGIDVQKLDDSRLLLVFNPIEIDDGPRTPLDLALSRDNGATWTTIAHLENDPDPDTEYSYPSIIMTKQGVAITYTYNRTTIRCWQIPEAALR